MVGGNGKQKSAQELRKWVKLDDGFKWLPYWLIGLYESRGGLLSFCGKGRNGAIKY